MAQIKITAPEYAVRNARTVRYYVSEGYKMARVRLSRHTAEKPALVWFLLSLDGNAYSHTSSYDVTEDEREAAACMLDHVAFAALDENDETDLGIGDFA